MAKQDLKKVKLVCEVEVEYEPFSSQKTNKKSEEIIRSWVENALNEECQSIPLWDDEDFSIMDRWARKSKIKVKKGVKQ